MTIKNYNELISLSRFYFFKECPDCIRFAWWHYLKLNQQKEKNSKCRLQQFETKSNDK